MKKEVFIELVLLKIEGGQLNDSSSVKRDDIRAYIAPAVNYVMSAAYNINIKTEENRDYSSLFYGYFPAQAISTDAARHNWKYITLPKGTVALPKNQGIRGIEDGCGYNLKPLSDNAFRTINHHAKVFVDEKFYRLEGRKIYLWNLPSVATNVNLSMIVDSNYLDDTDELPIQAGLEKLAIDTCYEFCVGIRQTAADRKSDQRDLN